VCPSHLSNGLQWLSWWQRVASNVFLMNTVLIFLDARTQLSPWMYVRQGKAGVTNVYQTTCSCEASRGSCIDSTRFTMLCAVTSSPLSLHKMRQHTWSWTHAALDGLSGDACRSAFKQYKSCMQAEFMSELEQMTRWKGNPCYEPTKVIKDQILLFESRIHGMCSE
jgi:hypothetical protein